MLTCVNHGFDITGYCSVCQEPVCDRCKDMHISCKIVEIDEYYNQKFLVLMILQEYIIHLACIIHATLI